ncbi:damage-control phosphatase ARMT1 family protein [Desulfospira joergensenii]|uniref:damage-control phosphatase ARMT1 family protein n=1 Tax=Desulfospira joergensenii TaxID=53329 RepID=UPI0003B3EC95|nr:ARMT1-like domain-containing protein [Desulfospira joergensenii]
MRMHNDCLPCIARGALDAARLSTDDELIQQKIVKTVLARLSQVEMDCPPPLMARFIQESVKELAGVDDPFKRLKKEYNDLALDLYPELKAEKDRAGTRSGRFETGVRLAIAGNIIDFGATSQVGRQKVLDTISHALSTRVNGEIRLLEQAVQKAENILWLADNTGEIVFDKLLLEEMDRDKIIYVVRGGNAQNDATMEDAQYTGITELVRVMDSGAAIPGTLVSICSKEFQRAYERADLIISKGQGNFETLDHRDKRIFFLFKAKCPIVATHAGCEPGDVVIRTSGDLSPRD